MAEITGRAAEARALVDYARGTLLLDRPQTLTALSRAVGLMLDDLTNEGRELAIAAMLALWRRGETD
jgi:hypothetical protein